MLLVLQFPIHFFGAIRSFFSKYLVVLERLAPVSVEPFVPFSVPFERFASLSQNFKSLSSGLLLVFNLYDFFRNSLVCFDRFCYVVLVLKVSARFRAVCSIL